MVRHIFYAIVILLLASISEAEGPSTYEIALSGKVCKEGDTQAISCEYRIGDGLHFSIDGIGQPDTGITFMKSSFNGDFYATYGLLHGCVIIKRGPKSVTSSNFTGPGSFTDYAFVSPKNGKVYTNGKIVSQHFNTS
jgi:hypothetical protein